MALNGNPLQKSHQEWNKNSTCPLHSIQRKAPRNSLVFSRFHNTQPTHTKESHEHCECWGNQCHQQEIRGQ